MRACLHACVRAIRIWDYACTRIVRIMRWGWGWGVVEVDVGVGVGVSVSVSVVV